MHRCFSYSRISLKHRCNARNNDETRRFHLNKLFEQEPEQQQGEKLVELMQPGRNHSNLHLHGCSVLNRSISYNGRHYNNWNRQSQFYSTRSMLFKSAAPYSNSSAYEDEEESFDDDFDEELRNEVEQFAALSLGRKHEQQQRQLLHHQQRHRQNGSTSRRNVWEDEESSKSLSDVDLELGEHSQWDEWEDSDDGDAAFSQWSDWKETDIHDDAVKESDQEDKRQDMINGGVGSSVYSNKHQRKLSPIDLLQNFDPENPPFSIDDVIQQQQKQPKLGEDKSVANDSPSLEDLQLWFECEAQQETVAKFRETMNSARDREDYLMMGPVKDQLMKWFPPLIKEIKRKQQEYYQVMEENKDGLVPMSWKNKQHISDYERSKIRSRVNLTYKYGNRLCMVDPEKLAVIISHEALLHALVFSGDGCSFQSMATKLGKALEEEIIVQNILEQRKERQKLSRQQNRTEEEEQQQQQEDEDQQERLQQNHQDNKSGNKNNRGSTHTESNLEGFMADISKGSPSRRSAAQAISRARKTLLERQKREEEYENLENQIILSDEDTVQVGAMLFEILHETATVEGEGGEQPAFLYESRWLRNQKRINVVKLNGYLHKLFVEDDFHSVANISMAQKPMVIPPKPWTSYKSGGYSWLRSDLVRYHGSAIQKEAVQNADLGMIFDGLNILGGEPWKINQSILNVAKKCWDQNIPLGDIPPQTDYIVPPLPDKLVALENLKSKYNKFRKKKKRMDKSSMNNDDNDTIEEDIDAEMRQIFRTEEYKTYKENIAKHRRMKGKNNDLVSLRCSAVLKLSQAEKFKNFKEIYFPYNIDFRGRAYPIPPHFSNVGSDLCRGMLKFAKEKPLGKRGLYWLKVHLANLAGEDKMPFDDRAEYTNQNLDHIRKSIENPIDYDWWRELEDPFQGLATCYEIINAIDSGNPETYMCSLPVHMDGSCNGLQHYAALGRDVVGGEAVNLTESDQPQDVYSGVMHEVIKRVKEDSERHYEFSEEDAELSKEEWKLLQNTKAAKLVNGLIDRGVVKRTVMTSVYGVTYVGARKQVQEKIEEKFEELGYDLVEMEREIFRACGYLATITMDAIGNLFTGAQETKNWLRKCARLICAEGYPVSWITPIGLPAVQPYREKRKHTVATIMANVVIQQESDDLPIDKRRQTSAFPPNYVHSLDSAHMIMTALEMDRRGLSFSAVHDSFWTHPCDVDEMNETLRECFVELYEQPLLENLKKSFELRYPDIDFPDLPQRGDLDLSDVKKAKYFFQ